MLITFVLKLWRVGVSRLGLGLGGNPNTLLPQYPSAPFEQTRQTQLERVGELTFSGFMSTKSHRSAGHICV